MDKKKCEGLTKTGKVCSRYALKGESYCKIHQTLTQINDYINTQNVEFSFNDDCPICLMPLSVSIASPRICNTPSPTNSGSGSGNIDKGVHITGCSHKLHIECAKGLKSKLCPLCRVVVINYPTEIDNIITENERNNRIKTEEEDRVNLINNENISLPFENFALIRIGQRIEVMCAMIFLRENGVPIRYIPTEINVGIPRDSPVPPEGVIFNTIVNYIIRNINDDISKETEFTPEDKNKNYDKKDPFGDKKIIPKVDVHIKSIF
jgi:hypothetical protein